MDRIQGKFYDEVILQISLPKIIDVSAADYTAETFKLNNQVAEKQYPFILAHHEEVTLRIVPWFGEELTWTFIPGERPIPLRKIISGHTDNTVETGIQIGY